MFYLSYALETLKIEKYKLIARLQKIAEKEENLGISLADHKRELKENLADIASVIEKLEGKTK